MYKTETSRGTILIKDEHGKILVSIQKNPEGYLYSVNPGLNILSITADKGMFIYIRTEDD